jgi:hypothetical protein
VRTHLRTYFFNVYGGNFNGEEKNKQKEAGVFQNPFDLGICLDLGGHSIRNSLGILLY